MQANLASDLPRVLGARLVSALAVEGAAPDIVVGLSAGPHSTGLLAALAAARDSDVADWPLGRLRAVHVHHGMQRDADAWAECASHSAGTLDVPLTVLCVDVVPGGKGPEAAARDARHAAVAADLADGELFVTGHHRDDQAETILLQLLRGSGAHGLRGMAMRRPFGAGWLVRPALAMDAEALAECARAANLEVVNDPSNTDENLARGWLRNRLAPILEARHPDWTESIVRAGTSLSDAVSVADDVASADLVGLLDERGACSVRGLLALTPARRRLGVRAWLVSAGYASPPAAFHEHLLNECLTARGDGAAELAVPGSRQQCDGNRAGAVLRRDRDRLYLLDADVVRRLQAGGAHRRVGGVPWCATWQTTGHPPAPLALPYGALVCSPEPDAQRLRLGATSGAGMTGALGVGDGEGMAAPELAASVVVRATALASGHWEVRLRGGGEEFRPAGRRRRSLGKWLSDSRLPPWERSLLPLLYRNGELVAVPGVGAISEISTGAVPEVGALSSIDTVRVAWCCGSGQASLSAVAT